MKRINGAEYSDLSRKMERNYITGFRLLSSVGDIQFREDNTIAEMRSGYQAAWMNGVFRIDGAADKLDKLISNTLKGYAQTDAQKVPMLWRVGVLTPDAEAVKETLGKYNPVASAEPGMVLDTTGYRPSKALPELEVQRVSTDSQVADWLVPYADAFNEKEPVVTHMENYICSALRTNSIDLKEAWFTGYVNKIPVASSYYLTDEDITVIYNVGTLSQFRNHGYGRRTVEAAINHALSECSLPISLYASEMGYPMYEKIGFVEIYRMEIFMFDSPNI